MTQIERTLYFRACQPSQFLGASFGDHQYNDDEDDEDAADLTDDELEDERQPS
jgi:hypothetical protein